MKKWGILLFLVGILAFNISSTFSNEPDNSSNVINNLESQSNGDFSEGETTWYFCWLQFTAGVLWPRQCGCCCSLPFTQPIGDFFYCAEDGGPSCPIN